MFVVQASLYYSVVNDNLECLPVSISWVLWLLVCVSMWGLCGVGDQTHGFMDAKLLLELHPLAPDASPREPHSNVNLLKSTPL